MPNQSPPLDRLFQALACPARRRIVERLTRGSASVTELAEPLDMALPSVMQHLGVLEKSGLIRSDKVGRVRTCRIDPAALAQMEIWISEQRAIWEARLDRLDEYVKNLPREGADE
jgi:DNA-binding transcriptional ArsR family regulator